MRKRNTEKAIDQAISASYARQARGRQINILRIGDLYRAAREQIAVGVDLDAAVRAAIEVYCEPV